MTEDVKKPARTPVARPASGKAQVAAAKPVQAAKSAPAPKAVAEPVVKAKPAARPATATVAKDSKPSPAPAKAPAPATPVVAKTPAPASVTSPSAPAQPVASEPVKAKQEVAPAPAATTIEGSKTMNEAVKTAQETTKKLTADASERVQAMFGEASERAKGAYEKSLKLAEEMTEFGKGNVEALVESSKLVAKGAESLGQEAADYARKSFENSTAAFKTFASAKSPTELFKLQSDYMKSSIDAAMAESSKVTEAWLKLAGEIAQPVSNRFAVAMEKVRATAL